MNDSGHERQEKNELFDDPVFTEIFLPLYRQYRQLDRGFDKRAIDSDLGALKKKLETIAAARSRRRVRE